MGQLFYIPTLMVCDVACWALIGTLMLVNWLQDRDNLELRLWSIGCLLGAFGLGLLSLRNGILADVWAVGFGNGIMLSGLGFLAIGFRVFDGRNPCHGQLQTGAAIWMGFYLLCPGFDENIDWRIILISVIMGYLAYDMARIIWAGRREEPLPSRKIMCAVLWLVVLVMALRIPLAILWPVSEHTAPGKDNWNGLLTYVIFSLTLFFGLCLFSISRERMVVRYKKAADTDALTGIFNRRAFYRIVGDRIHRHTGAVAVIDLDHFKQINDRYGHGGGDMVLCSFTGTVSALLGRDAVFGRLGGEEFVLYLPELSPSEAFSFCDELRRLIAERPVPWQGQQIFLTASIGLAEVDKAAQDVEVLIQKADIGVYTAKQQGRNRTVLIPGTSEASSAPASFTGESGFSLTSALTTPFAS
ncbi:diguanylate cyclase [Allorhizobium sp. BGMRC 0089]|uniref:GGDEF domain-containing protein n=1 Tax=Allorhizobium sonneratiae TaxID=2934936 RepID=UPI0020339643|nr:diguanylate cyclase [Allorhizobium sonneratiae]MCM2292227.1 diguanylate cyclase [Allorhizobium sonneratiae]